MRLSVSLESASERFVLVQVAAAVVGAEAGEDMEVAAVEEDMEVAVVEATAAAGVEVAEAVAAEGSVVEDEEVVEVAEAVAGAGVDAKETGFALTRGAFPIVCSSIFCWTRFLHLCYSGLVLRILACRLETSTTVSRCFLRVWVIESLCCRIMICMRHGVQDLAPCSFSLI